jgi:hypothetical protein
MNRHLESTDAVESRCAHCGARILVALDEGLHVRADTTPIPPAGEVAVLVTGRLTYTRTVMTNQLVQRTAARIAAGFPRGTIHAQHTCQRSTR